MHFTERLAYPCRYTDMVPRFGRNPTELCLIFNEVLDFIYTSHRHRLQNWDKNPFLQPDQLHRYADAIHQQYGGRHLITVLVLWMALLEVLLVQSIINVSCIMDTSVFTV